MRPSIILACALVSLLPLSAQTQLHAVSGGATAPTLGERVTGLSDHDADFVDDFAAAGVSFIPGSSGMSQVVVRVFSGATGAQLGEFTTAPALRALPHIDLVRMNDQNGDGIDEFAMSVTDSSLGPIISGEVIVLDGATVSPLNTFTTPTVPGAAYGFSLASADVDGDGLHDLAISAPRGALLGRFFEIRSGANGSQILGPSVIPGAFEFVGWDLEFVDDFDGDTRPDLAVTSPLENRVFVVSSASGAVLRTLLSPATVQPTGAFGMAVASLQDSTGDGRGELAITKFSPPELLIVDAQTENTLHTVTIAAGDGSRIDRVQDVNGDGFDDVVLANGHLTGIVEIRSGIDGDFVLGLSWPAGPLMFPFSIPESSTDIAGISDLNGDGAGEIILGRRSDGIVAVFSTATVGATTTTLGSPSAPGPFLPVLGATAPQLGGVMDVTITGALPFTNGTLVVSPGPESPFPVFPGFVIYVDLIQAASWVSIPVTTSSAGFFHLPAPLPESVSFAGTQVTMQAIFPSGLGISGSSITNGLRVRLGP